MFTLALAAVMFSGMVVCMGMFLKHVIHSIPEVVDINHRVCLCKQSRLKIFQRERF